MSALRWVSELSVGLACVALAAVLVRPPPAVAPPESAARSASSLPGSAPPLVASYTLDARLDAASHRIKGKGRIEWHNSSRVPVSSLFFHLYLNAFKNDRTLFFRSPFGAGRGGGRPRNYGYIDVQSLRAVELGGLDLWPTRRPHTPGDPQDETDIEVALPRPILPAEKLTLELEFEAQLPEVVERTGYVGSFHLVAQWFPKLARLEPDGTFAHFPFHAQSEFYADYGRYDVTLDVPVGYLVGASGQRVAVSSAGGRRRERYLAEPVHDFAWTAWDGFVERRAKIGDVAVTLLHPPGHATSQAATLTTLQHALPELERRFGAYPYPTLTVVHPPAGADAAGGMEYPTLITTGGPWYLPHSGVRVLEAVTVHELAHQWFYGLLASNEARAPFLDEGLTSFAEMRVMNQRFGASSMGELLGLAVASESVFRAVAAASAADEPVGSEAARFSGFNNLGALAYSRTATILETVARVWGRERMQRALERYALSNRFGHPQPADLLAAIREHVGDAAATVVSRALLARGRVNYLVREVQNARRATPAGFFDKPGGREHVVRDGREAGGYSTRVTLFRHGDLEIPVELQLVFEGGRQRIERWDGRGDFQVFENHGPERLLFAVVDPERKLLLDEDLLDNQAAAEEVGQPRTHERMAYWASLLLGGVAP